MQRQTKNREKILEGALRVFLTHGYSANMDTIAAESGVVKQTIYSHFKDKEGLFSALVDRLLDKFVSAGMNAELMQLEPPAFFRKLTQIGLHHMDDWEYIALIRLIIGESMRFPELSQLYLLRLVRPGIEGLQAYIANHEDMRFSDPEAIARVIHGALVYFMISQELLNGKFTMPMSRDRLSNALVEMVLFAAEQSKHSR